MWSWIKFTHRHNAEHGQGDKHVVEVGEDVLLDGDDGGEEVSEEDWGEGEYKKHVELKFTFSTFEPEKEEDKSTKHEGEDN